MGGKREKISLSYIAEHLMDQWEATKIYDEETNVIESTLYRDFPTRSLQDKL